MHTTLNAHSLLIRFYSLSQLILCVSNYDVLNFRWINTVTTKGSYLFCWGTMSWTTGNPWKQLLKNTYGILLNTKVVFCTKCTAFKTKNEEFSCHGIGPERS